MEKENQQPIPDQLFNEYMAEYNTLRSEIVRRIEIRNSIVFGVLTFAGVLLSFGLEIPTLAIIYTIISMFLAAAWVQSDVMISGIGCYIREKIEPDARGLNWETYRQQARLEDSQRRGIHPSVVFSTSGILFYHPDHRAGHCLFKCPIILSAGLGSRRSSRLSVSY